MMRALFGSLREKAILAHSPAAGAEGNAEKDGYSPNPGPLFEVGGHARNASFLRAQPDNVLIKIFFDSVLELPAGQHTVIFMERDPEEIRQSLKMVEAHFDSIGFTNYQKACDERAFDVYREYDQDDIDHVLGILNQRKDITLIRVNYGDLVSDPGSVFRQIGRHLDLDVDKAKSLINSKFYRARNNEYSKERRSRACTNR